MFLYIDLPRFDFPVVFCESEAANLSSSIFSPTHSGLPASLQTPSISSDPHLWTVIDLDVARDNPVEDKHRRLVRSHRSGPYDRELKPNAKIRDELTVSFGLNNSKGV